MIQTNLIPEEEFLRIAPKEFLPAGDEEDPERSMLLARLNHEKKTREEYVDVLHGLLLIF